jgi:Ca2+-binding RTX toxin-like protein
MIQILIMKTRSKGIYSMSNFIGKVIRIIVVGVLALALLTIFSAVAASNTVPTTRADKNSIGINADTVKPPECNGITLTNIVDVGAGESGTAANDLILGTDKADAEIRGGDGDDCILGGKGNERQKIGKDWYPGLYGEDGDDVLIGGPGNKDHCDGGAGTDLYFTCETTY